GQLANADIVQGDILRPPFPNSENGGPFDLVYCIGVLHHLPDPGRGFSSLTRLVAPGGTLAVWVYAWEGNEVVRLLVDPLRRLLRRAPPSLIRLLAFPLALALFALVHSVYRPRAAEALPLGRYLRSLRGF